jgi:quinoprotein glucose dehydrogenase
MGSLAHAVRATNYSVSAAPVVCKDVIVVGASIHDGPTHKEWPRGDVSGFEVRTGKKLWTIHSIPQKGRVWQRDVGRLIRGPTRAAPTSGPTCRRTRSSATCFFRLVRPPTTFYGGHRPGANLFAETIMAIDAKTGKRAWHFQGVHHGVWDYDFPAAPILVDINVSGKPIKALAQVSKQGFTYVLDRRTGAPVWPFESGRCRSRLFPANARRQRSRSRPSRPPTSGKA